jgi:hypothetical protein
LTLGKQALLLAPQHPISRAANDDDERGIDSLDNLWFARSGAEGEQFGGMN